jgi:hypothetical protein
MLYVSHLRVFDIGGDSQERNPAYNESHLHMSEPLPAGFVAQDPFGFQNTSTSRNDKLPLSSRFNVN